MASQADLLTGLYKLELKTLDKAILAKQAYVLLLPVKQTKNYLRLPKEAVFEKKGDEISLWRVKAGKAELVQLKIGLESEEYYQVSEPLEKGDQVVLTGKSQLSAEESVRVVETLTSISQMVAKK